MILHQKIFEKHKALQAEMNVWPSKDSIRVVDDCIVVNLSKIIWYFIFLRVGQ